MIDQTRSQLSDILSRLDEQENQTNRVEAKNHKVTTKNQRVIEENQKLRREFEELRSQPNGVLEKMDDQMSRGVMKELFPELNDQPRRLAIAEEQTQIEQLQRNRAKLNISQLEKISSLEAKVNSNRSQYKSMTEGIS